MLPLVTCRIAAQTRWQSGDLCGKAALEDGSHHGCRPHNYLRASQRSGQVHQVEDLPEASSRQLLSGQEWCAKSRTQDGEIHSVILWPEEFERVAKLFCQQLSELLASVPAQSAPDEQR